MSQSKLFHPPKGEDDHHAYHTPLEKKVKELLTPFQEYINIQATASILLIVCTISALLWASFPFISKSYQAFISMSLGFHLGSFTIKKSLQFWVNDVLLTLFFFFVGLEIKREFLVGELTNHKRAIFVLFAALGGMIVPAALYFLWNFGKPTQFGWGIPMATDTAFALGILSCFKKKLPKGIFTFMAALAILDDIGAIIVIATIYTTHLNMTMLTLALLFVGILIFLNYAGFRKPWPYILFGIIIWGFIEAAGIHGTISGILVAFLIPARPRRGPRHFLKRMRVLIQYFEERKAKNPRVLEDPKQHAVLEEVQEVAEQATTPLQRWENRLELPIALLILPLFALVNAGIPISFHLLDEVFTRPVSLGILFGLVIGKPIGVLFFGQMALWLRVGVLPKKLRFRDIASVSFLAGIGFTMSLFIANLSFDSLENTLLLSKAAIFMGSLIAAMVGIFCLIMTKSTQNSKTESVQ